MKNDDGLSVETAGMPDGDAVGHLAGDLILSEGTTIMTALALLVGILASSRSDWGYRRHLRSGLRGVKRDSVARTAGAQGEKKENAPLPAEAASQRSYDAARLVSERSSFLDGEKKRLTRRQSSTSSALPRTVRPRSALAIRRAPASADRLLAQNVIIPFVALPASVRPPTNSRGDPGRAC